MTAGYLTGILILLSPSTEHALSEAPRDEAHGIKTGGVGHHGN